MSCLEFYTFHLTDEGWIRGDERECGETIERAPGGVVYLTITHYSDGDCSSGSIEYDHTDYIDESQRDKIIDLLSHFPAPEIIRNEIRKLGFDITR